MPVIKNVRDQSVLSNAPAIHGAVVTPHDTNEQVYRSLWVGGVGNVNLRFIGDTTDTLITAVPAGTLLPFAVKLVLATNTSATLIIGLS